MVRYDHLMSKLLSRFYVHTNAVDVIFVFCAGESHTYFLGRIDNTNASSAPH